MPKKSAKAAPDTPEQVSQATDNSGDWGRTQEALESLADSVGQVMGRMRSVDRRQTLNSFVAYILFTVLLGGGFALLYHSRVGGLVRARDLALTERDAARERVVEVQNQIARRDAAAKEAYDYYTLIRDKRRTEVISEYPSVEGLELTPAEREFFAHGVERARAEMVDAGYLAGLDAFRKGEYDRAIRELERALGYEVEGQQAALMRYYLGVAQHKSGKSEEGIRNLELALAGPIAEAGVSDARYQLAAAFEAVGSLDEARKEYQKFASSSPRSPLAPAALRKVNYLGRQIAMASAREAGPPSASPKPANSAAKPANAPAPSPTPKSVADPGPAPVDGQP